MAEHIPYMIISSIAAFYIGFVIGGYTYRRMSVSRRWRRSRRRIEGVNILRAMRGSGSTPLCMED